MASNYSPLVAVVDGTLPPVLQGKKYPPKPKDADHNPAYIDYEALMLSKLKQTFMDRNERDELTQSAVRSGLEILAAGPREHWGDFAHLAAFIADRIPDPLEIRLAKGMVPDHMGDYLTKGTIVVKGDVGLETGAVGGGMLLVYGNAQGVQLPSGCSHNNSPHIVYIDGDVDELSDPFNVDTLLIVAGSIKKVGKAGWHNSPISYYPLATVISPVAVELSGWAPRYGTEPPKCQTYVFPKEELVQWPPEEVAVRAEGLLRRICEQRVRSMSESLQNAIGFAGASKWLQETSVPYAFQKGQEHGWMDERRANPLPYDD